MRVAEVEKVVLPFERLGLRDHRPHVIGQVERGCTRRKQRKESGEKDGANEDTRHGAVRCVYTHFMPVDMGGVVAGLVLALLVALTLLSLFSGSQAPDDNRAPKLPPGWKAVRPADNLPEFRVWLGNQTEQNRPKS